MRDTVSPNATSTTSVISDVLAERRRQDAKWGQQDHPSLDPALLTRRGGCTPERMAEDYEIPSELRAKWLCRNAFSHKRGTFAHIAVEELAESIACMDDEESMYEEVVQLAASAIAWAEAIRRRLGK